MKFKIDYIIPPEKRRKDSFWYDGQVATISYKGRTISIEATGHIDASYRENDISPKSARMFGFTDRRLKFFHWSNNNWFTLYEQKGDEFEWIADSVAYTYDEAIRLAKYYIQHLAGCDLPKKSKNKHLAI